MKQDLLTIIVPCFNVEEYLPTCLDSLINQTYKNFHVILVDDGSTDRTGQICDKYTQKDSRFSVIHKNNGGSSESRNTGIKKAQTEFITFVDSDDYIHPEMYNILMSNILSENNADIIACGVCDLINDKIRHRKSKEITPQYEKVNRKQGVLNILYDKDWKSYSCNKIFRRSLFNDIKYPEGRHLDEDTSIMFLLYHTARLSLYNTSELYVYRHREGSVCLSYSKEAMVKKAIDRIGARYERLKFVEDHPEYHETLNIITNNFLAVGLAVLRIAAKYPTLFPENFFSNNLSKIRNARVDSYTTEYFNTRKRIELWFLKNMTCIFKFVYKFIPAW